MTNKQEQFDGALVFGDFKTVKLLINDPDVDPSADDNDAIRFASFFGYKEIVKLLLTDERVMDKIDVALKECKEYGGGCELMKACVDEHKHQEKERRVREAIEEMSADCELYF